MPIIKKIDLKEFYSMQKVLMIKEAYHNNQFI